MNYKKMKKAETPAGVLAGNFHGSSWRGNAFRVK